MACGQSSRIGTVHAGTWWAIGASLLMGTVGAGVEAAEEAPAAMTIQDNVDVGIEYTLTVDGAVVDSTEGKGAFHYVQGKHQVIPGLEHQLAGLHVGDARELTVSPEDGFGPIDPQAFVEVPKSQLPADLTPSVGMVLRGVNPEGTSFRATIRDIKDQSVMLDLNHPLAGKTLLFKVTIVDVAPAKSL